MRGGWRTKLKPYCFALTRDNPQTHLDTYPESEPAQELHSRAAPSVEARHRSVGPDTGRNSGGRQIKKKKKKIFWIEIELNIITSLFKAKKKLGPLLKKQFFILYFQITGLANDGPSSFFEEPSSVIFEEVKYDLHDGSDSWRMSILWTNQTIWFSFFIFTYKKEASFFTRFEELLKVNDFG